MMGFAFVGILTSAVVLWLWGRRFPPKTGIYEA